MLVITVNRTIALIKCKHPNYNTEIKVKYQCNIQAKQWKLIYENKNFTCRMLKKKLFIFKENLFSFIAGYIVPPMSISTNTTRSSKKPTTSTKTIKLQSKN